MHQLTQLAAAQHRQRLAAERRMRRDARQARQLRAQLQAQTTNDQ
jgi:hypothetical protein